MAVAVVERWPLSRGLDGSVCKDHPLRRKKCHLRQVAVVERWALMEVHNLKQYNVSFKFIHRAGWQP